MHGRAFNAFKDYTDVEPFLEGVAQCTEHLKLLQEVVYPALKTCTDEYKEKQEEQFLRSNKINPQKFAIGQKVMMKPIEKPGKLNPRLEGPFTIEGALENDCTYTLRDQTGTVLKRKVPAHFLQAFRSKEDLEVTETGTNTRKCKAIGNLERNPKNTKKSKEEENIFQVEKIIDHEQRANVTYYLVKWKGFDSSQNTWEPSTNFNSTQIIKEYWKKCQQQHKKNKPIKEDNATALSKGRC